MKTIKNGQCVRLHLDILFALFFFFNFWSRNERYLLLERFSSKATDKLVQLWNCQPSKRSPLEIGWFLVFHAKWVRSINGIWNKFQTKSPIKPSVVQNKTVNVLSNSKLGLNVRGVNEVLFTLFTLCHRFVFFFSFSCVENLVYF